MNQWIMICYKSSNLPNYWDIGFYLNGKIHREKVPSWLDNDGDWELWFQGELQKQGYNFDWNKT